ncbi:NADH dehydrogenase I, N subunit [Thioploca ingrica]|uniref:NADH-quinone oxidoreductase subunit N n=1 Tax=Thioploca ingrica TaxID=40754 RepID=A0A090AML0_9GAMM|nr:NADH dehydrogenase I, N subunit [Thioploca ingrica]
MMVANLNTIWLLPEILLLTMACLILVIDAYLPEQLRNLTYQLTQGTLLGTGLLILANYPQQQILAMNNLFVSDPLSGLLKFLIVIVVFWVFIYSRRYLRDHNMFKGEYFVLGLLAVLGMMVIVSAHSLLTIYLGLELLSLSLYTMVAMHRDSPAATEAAMKYFVLGALASGLLLYGISILYGITGTLDLAKLAQLLTQESEQKTIMIFGLVFVVVGLAFKLGAVPFHMWVPDVYQGAPTAVTLFISTAPKLAAFAMLMRLLVDGMPQLHTNWQQILILLSILSMAIGNIVAISQTNIKRMLAYSTISHVGFLMLGVLTATPAGYAASLFYVVVYTLMSLGGFGVILLLSRGGFEAERLEDFKGLNERNSWYAFIMLILMLSMAGMPPLLGFWAKWSVLIQVVQAGLVWLAVAAVFFAIIGAFYYLRIVKLMYFDKSENLILIEAGMDMRVALSVNALVILFLGLMPHTLMTVCLSALGIT